MEKPTIQTIVGQAILILLAAGAVFVPLVRRPGATSAAPADQGPPQAHQPAS